MFRVDEGRSTLFSVRLKVKLCWHGSLISLLINFASSGVTFLVESDGIWNSNG
jgi:hypothetical protein